MCKRTAALMLACLLIAGCKDADELMRQRDEANTRVRWLITLSAVLGISCVVCLVIGAGVGSAARRTVEEVSHAKP